MSKHKLHLLLSYHYAKRWPGLAYPAMRYGHDRGVVWMVDSGAFSAYSQSVKTLQRQEDIVTLDDYCTWLTPVLDIVDRYVMLDVIRDAEGTQRNLALMRARGLTPMPVVTPWHTMEQVTQMVAEGATQLCVSGGFNGSRDWLRGRIENVARATGGKATIHGLAGVVYPELLHLPLASVDSSAWMAGARWGTMCGFSPARGVYSLGDEEARQQLARYLVPPKAVAPQHYRGDNGAGMFLTMLAYLRFHHYLASQGKQLFLVVPSITFFAVLLCAFEALEENLSYPEFYARSRARRALLKEMR